VILHVEKLREAISYTQRAVAIMEIGFGECRAVLLPAG
jgi:hypothetical protein